LEILSGEMVIARIFNIEELNHEGLKFLSQESDFLQIGFWNHAKATELQAHIHNEFERTVSRTSEMIFVFCGRVHADIYGDDGNLISEHELVAGDILISLRGGHGYKIMDNNTKVIEVKNGPYFGPEIDRRRITELCSLSSRRSR
jgi:hypothetical protein